MRNYHLSSMLIEHLSEPPPRKKDESYSSWSDVPKTNDASLLQKKFYLENSMRYLGFENDHSHTKRLQRKIDVKLGRTLCGKESLFWKSIGFDQDGQQRSTQPHEFGFNQENLT
ncbi:hypothetical protein EPI10_014896 [Gossypium australe]|uniref:Uncharacterized protein n=1 Tax=Gossypium australe TaxID=47621 RepID=A0A5B6VJ37_9ROSI|nr:hypothetical protein EPI10_014896 [Gossypium australe]